MQMSKRVRGSVSILLCLILVPMITYSTMIIDASRLQAVRTNISGAGELTLNALMSDYYDLLEEMYGLFANCNEEAELQDALRAYFLQTVEGRFLPEKGLDDQYVQRFINGTVDTLFDADGNAINTELTDFLKTQLSDNFYAGPVNGSALANPNTMKRQIIEYMKYRGPISLASTLLGKIDYLSDSSSQLEACDNKVEYAKKLGELQEPCLKAFESIDSQYNPGAMMMNEMLGCGVENKSDDYLKELLEDSKAEYKKATAFYILDAQSPFYNTANDGGIHKGNFYDYGGLGDEYFQNTNSISAEEKNNVNNGYSNFGTASSDPNIAANDFATRTRARISAMEKLIDAAKNIGNYKALEDREDTNQKFNQGYDIVRSNISYDSRHINMYTGEDASLSTYSGDDDAGKINADTVEGRKKNVNGRMMYPHMNHYLIKDKEDKNGLYAPYLNEPKKTDTFDDQLNKAREIYLAQLDIENTYKEDVAVYASNHKRLRAISQRMDKIWEELQNDMIQAFRDSIQGRLQEIEKQHQDVDRTEREYKAAMTTYNSYSYPNFREDQVEEYNEALTRYETYMEDPDAWDEDEDIPLEPVKHTEPKRAEPTVKERFKYEDEWPRFCANYNNDGSLDYVDRHCIAMRQIVKQMDGYEGEVNGFLAKAAHHNGDYYLKIASVYNENGYSGIAGVCMTLKTMEEALSTANDRLQDILDLITKDKNGDKCLESRKAEWEDSILGQNGKKGINSDSSKAAMLSDCNTLSKQFDKNAVTKLKNLIVGEDGKSGLLKKTKDVRLDFEGIKYLDTKLCELVSADKVFSAAAMGEFRTKVGDDIPKFLNPCNSELIQGFNDKVWKNICGDKVIPKFPEFEGTKDTWCVQQFNSVTFDATKSRSVLDAADSLIKNKDEKIGYNTKSLYKQNSSSYKDEISHFRILDGIKDEVGYKDKSEYGDLKASGDTSILDEDEAFMITLYTEAKAAETAEAAKKEQEETNTEGPEDTLTDAAEEQIEHAKEEPESNEDDMDPASKEFNFAERMDQISAYITLDSKDEQMAVPTVNNASISKGKDAGKSSDGGALKAAKGIVADISNIGGKIVENVYLEEYLTELFTCRTDNQMLNTLTADANKKVLPVIMLNGYGNAAAFGDSLDSNSKLLNEKTPWYGKEIEYLLWGNSNLNKNLTCTDGLIFAVRFALNAIYAFTAPDIQTYALELATAIAGWTVVGVPIVQACITILIALAESGYDLYLLHDGRDVPIYKNQMTFVCSPHGMLREVVSKTVENVTTSVLSSAHEQLEKKIDDELDAAGEAIVSAGEKRADQLSETVSGYVNEQSEAIKSAIKEQFINPILNQIVPLGSLIDICGKYVDKTEQAAHKMIENAVNDAMKEIDNNINQMGEGVVKEIITDIFNSEKETIKAKAVSKIETYFKTIKGELPVINEENPLPPLEEQLGEYIDGVIDQFSGPIDEKVKAAANSFKQAINKATDITVDNAKTVIHRELDKATEQLTGKVNQLTSEALDKIPLGDPKNVDPDADSGVTLNYKEYCKIFMMLFVSVNQDRILQRAAVLIEANMRCALPEDRRTNFDITKANTLFSVNSTVDMVTLFPWPVKDVQDETSTETGLQLDLSHIRSSVVQINYCGVNGY